MLLEYANMNEPTCFADKEMVQKKKSQNKLYKEKKCINRLIFGKKLNNHISPIQ